ncbi:hypothetical protein AOLI_G00180320 [Acnodon oligacanthus]
MCLSRILAVSRAESKSRDVPRAPVVPPRRGSSKALYVAVHIHSHSVLPLIKASCPLPVQDIKGDWLENVGLDVYDDPSPPPPVQPEKTPELTFNLPSKSLDTLFSARLLGNETPEPKGVKEFLATPEYEHEESQARVKEVSTAADYQSRSSMVVKEVGVLKTLSDLSDECSEIFKAYQIYRRYGPANRPCTYLVKCTESPLEDSPDFSHSIPAVQVTEASEDLVDNNKDLETPADPDGEVLRMPPHLEK